MKWILALITICFLNIGFCADPIVAEVEGTTIRKSTLMEYHKQNLNFVQSNKDTSIEASLNDLIDRAIGIKKAKAAGVHKRPEVVKKMNDIIYHAHVSDVLTPKLKKISVNDNDIKNYYKKYPEYKTSQILLRLRTIPSSEEVADAVKLANEIYEAAKKNPKDFAKLAQQYSQATNSLSGGEMGYQPRTRLSKEYYEAVLGKNNGYITRPVRTQYGIHIIKVEGVKTYEQIDKKLYKKIVYDMKRDQILKDYFDKTRKASKVKINRKALKL